MTSMRWDGSADGAATVLDWCCANGGEARYSECACGMTGSHEGSSPRIVITGPDGRDVVMAPGDEAVKGERRFCSAGVPNCRPCLAPIREFTVRRPTPEETT